jgi:hypothetical protein
VNVSRIIEIRLFRYEVMTADKHSFARAADALGTKQLTSSRRSPISQFVWADNKNAALKHFFKLIKECYPVHAVA